MQSELNLCHLSVITGFSWCVYWSCVDFQREFENFENLSHYIHTEFGMRFELRSMWWENPKSQNMFVHSCSNNWFINHNVATNNCVNIDLGANCSSLGGSTSSEVQLGMEVGCWDAVEYSRMVCSLPFCACLDAILVVKSYFLSRLLLWDAWNMPSTDVRVPLIVILMCFHNWKCYHCTRVL